MKKYISDYVGRRNTFVVIKLIVQIYKYISIYKLLTLVDTGDRCLIHTNARLWLPSYDCKRLQLSFRNIKVSTHLPIITLQSFYVYSNRRISSTMLTSTDLTVRTSAKKIEFLQVCPLTLDHPFISICAYQNALGRNRFLNGMNRLILSYRLNVIVKVVRSIPFQFRRLP